MEKLQTFVREHLYVMYVRVFYGFLEPPSPLGKDILVTRSKEKLPLLKHYKFR